MADPQLQELSLDEAMGLRVGDEFFARLDSPHPDWRRYYVPAVQLSVAENLAAELEEYAKRLARKESPHARWVAVDLRRMVAEFRRVVPARTTEETTG